MAERPNDRPDAASPPEAGGPADEPRIFVVVDGRKFPRPGLETFFADTSGPAPVVGTYCACNKVCRCVPVCGAVGYKACSCVGNICSCVGHRSYGGGFVGGGCRCAPVH